MENIPKLSERLKPYTILLLYPDYIASTYGQDTYTSWVRGLDIPSAISKARISAWEYNMRKGNLVDYFVLAVFEGHYMDLKP